MTVPRVPVFAVAAAVFAAFLSIAAGGDPVPRLVAAALLVIATLWLPGTDDSTIAILATGELLVIATAQAVFAAGVVVQCIIAVAVLAGGRSPSGRRDIPLAFGFCVAAIAGAVVLDTANQVFLPFAALVAILLIAAGAAVGYLELRERRRYAGGTR